MPIVGAIGSAVIGAGATLAASRSASRASSQATQAAQQSNADNIQLARETRDANTALYAGDLARGTAADQYLDRIYGLPGLSAASAAQTYAPTNIAQTDYRPNRPYRPRFGEEDTSYGDMTGVGGIEAVNTAAAPVRDTRNIDYAQIERDRPDVAAEAARNNMTVRQYVDTHWLPAGGVKEQLGDTYNVPYLDLQDTYRGTEPYLLTEGQYADTAAEIGRTADEQTGLLNDWRNSSTANNEQDYRTLSGFTDAAINDVSALRERGARDYLDRAGGTFGVTGRLGSVGRDYADSMDRLNQGFATTVRDWRQGDYNPYADRRNFIGDTYQTGAQGIAGERGSRNLTNIGNRYAGRQSAYGNWEGYLRDQSNRGATGRNAIAGFNGDFRNSAAASNTANANAIAAGAQNASNIYASTAGNLANIFGNAVGSYNYNRNPGKDGAGNKIENIMTKAAGNAVRSIWRRK